ncbi:L,D-transpeptidase [Gemmatimonas sp.]|uniref:L,D-transpeptidase n=1 Tax=Gemmatimonas sp. TaxID=1962908 RepID=UPI0022BD5F99|nr:L,D-transpeptidase [Gemmatimonas sp.]MCZ8203261.1 L,D-transpeptidase [Gemmatimonas sp.]
MRVRRRTLVLVLSLVALLLVDGLLLRRRARYREETARLRAGMSELEQKRADAIMAANVDKATLMLELMRRQARGDAALHLAVNTDSGYVALDRGGARLRTMPARIGPERRVGSGADTAHVVIPRGVRSIERLLGASDAWPLPDWLWADRGLPPVAKHATPGWTGTHAIVTTGGTLLYAVPGSGPLADSSYVMPGSVRLDAGDLRAIRENLTPGTRVYFY